MATPIPSNRAIVTIEDAARATGGTIVRAGSVPLAGGIVTDSRAITRGSVFVALVGETHDAHAFLDKACGSAPAYVVVQKGRSPADPAVGVLEVDDTLVALGALANTWLERWRANRASAADGAGRIVGITGSAGKTTTKELTAALLGQVGKTLATSGNLNNRIGVPMTVLSIDDSDAFAVLEMGMSLPGEIAAVAGIARPDVAIITNVGLAHAEGVGGREGVMREKGAIYRALDDHGVAVINADDDFATRAAEGIRAKTKITFGQRAPADYALVAREPRDGGSALTIRTPHREIAIFLPLPGEAAAIDLVAALAAQEAATGVRLETARIEEGLARVRLAGRAAIVKLGGDVVVLDDTYNANPASVRAALATLGELAGAGRRRVAVLGEMKELGAHAEAEHAALGEVIASAGVALAIGCGGLVDLALDGAEARGTRVLRARSTEEAAAIARENVRGGDVVLVKGSRSVGAERVTAALSEAWPSAPKPASSSSA
ncbi:MAG: UDP-N-acetylmuramoyl-tripeptide--D-alanyl-D-alanine ligase [Deltaproteobacteria bacterium]|nr:UDP-N-acetylmuramoyl-tripeptide--D-alanyl-D-alanine ligase [Deltaproteobacteria bacterium]